MIIDTSQIVVLSGTITFWLSLTGIFLSAIAMPVFWTDAALEKPHMPLILRIVFGVGVLTLLSANYIGAVNNSKRNDYIAKQLRENTGYEANHVKDNTFELYQDGRFQCFAYVKQVGEEKYEISYTNID